MAGKGKELRAKVKELTEALEKEQSANKLNTVEFQVRSSVSLKYPAKWDTILYRVPCRHFCNVLVFLGSLNLQACLSIK